MTRQPSEPHAQLTMEQALAWIREMFEEPAAPIGPSTRRADIRSWDSLGQLVLMSELDQRFGIRLTPQELASLASIQDILDILRTHGRLGAA